MMNHPIRRRRTLLPSFILAALAIAGCGEVPTNPGTTIGGAKDIGYARNIIESGGIPAPEYIVAEGLYSEHDIATAAGECSDRLCLALGYGYATSVDDSANALFVHLGFSTNVKPEEFHRPDLQLALVVDKSGSMAGGSMDAVKDALHSLVDKLTENDEVALVEFNDDSKLVMDARRMNAAGKAALHGKIDGLTSDGGTNIEAGMKEGYTILDKLAPGEGKSKRLMLFTDAMPNVGGTARSLFEEMTQQYSDRGIGLTAFGVGINFGQELIYHISRLRGGNFFFLQNEERIRTIFDEEFEYLVTPIAYDLQVTIRTPPGARLDTVFGLPDWKPGDVEAVLNIPTVFFSRNRGAIILRYRPATPGFYSIESGQLLAAGNISYSDPDGTPTARQRELRHDGPILADGRHFSHDGTRLGVALTNTYVALNTACRRYHGNDKPGAIAILDRGIAYVETENATLNDPGLATELALMRKLKGNIEGP